MNRHWLFVGVAALALTGIRSSTARAAEEQEENEVKISFKQAPSPVRKTLKREANGEKIKTLDKEKLKGKTVYEADVKIDGHNYEIVVDPHGLLIHKQLDESEESAAGSSKKESKKSEGKKSTSQAQDEDDNGNAHSTKHAKNGKSEEGEDDDQAKTASKHLKADKNADDEGDKNEEADGDNHAKTSSKHVKADKNEDHEDNDEK